MAYDLKRNEMKVKFSFFLASALFPALTTMNIFLSIISPKISFSGIYTHSFACMCMYIHSLLFKKEIIQNKSHYTQYFRLRSVFSIFNNATINSRILT